MLYTAEEKEPTKETDISKRRKGEESDGLESYEYRPQLGSAYIGKFYPKVFQLNFNLASESGSSAQLYSIDPDLVAKQDSLRDPILSQAIFSPNGDQVLLTAYPALIDGRRLGLGACSNRPSIVYSINGNASEDQKNNSSEEKEASSNNSIIKNALNWKPQNWHRLSREGESGRAPAVASKDKCV